MGQAAAKTWLLGRRANAIFGGVPGAGEPPLGGSDLLKWPWLSTPMGSHFGVGAPPILAYFSGDWDVHSKYGVLTHRQMAVVVKTQETPGEHHNRWQMDVHPPQNGIAIGSAPWPNGCVKPGDTILGHGGNHQTRHLGSWTVAYSVHVQKEILWRVTPHFETIGYLEAYQDKHPLQLPSGWAIVKICCR